MCKWKSGIVTRSGEVYTHWNTDSHEELITLFSLKDTGLDYLVRVEFSTKNQEDLADISKYVLKVDESATPAWFEDFRESTTENMKAIVECAIKIDGNLELILDGEHILKNGKYNKIRGGRILYICGSAQVEYICGSAQVEYICGSAQVEYIGDSAQVEYICGSAQVVNDERRK